MNLIPAPERKDADEPRFTVGVVAERVGVPTATLRSWNQRYGVGPPDHSPGRHRLYSENDIAIVLRMFELIAQGASPRSAARTAIESVRPARGDAAALLIAAFDLDVVTAGLLLDRHLRHFGVIDTWDQLVRPAFSGIETQQAEGVDCIDVEHVLSWTVARSLQRLPIAAADGASSIVLGCAARETHTLSLEALRAALGERGVGAVMLGADVPTACAPRCRQSCGGAGDSGVVVADRADRRLRGGRRARATCAGDGRRAGLESGAARGGAGGEPARRRAALRA